MPQTSPIIHSHKKELCVLHTRHGCTNPTQCVPPHPSSISGSVPAFNEICAAMQATNTAVRDELCYLRTAAASDKRS